MEDAYLGQAKDIILGQDFLTWLWYKSEAKAGLFTMPDGEAFSLFMEQRISVQGGEGDSKETTSVSGLMSELREAKLGLAMGKKVTKGQIRIEVDSDAWQMSLRAEDFSFNGFKTPKVDTKRDEGDDPDAIFLEKMYLIERGLSFIDHLFFEFLKLRLSEGWAEECENVRVWLSK
ncbi:hypothetical protein GGQ74_002668 [Desulfobaculum xiamenense]|uniref:Recombination-associated protein RdgC n=1 Tax=Desulfobaculum xiamenense TaxID=995050 RepID=A0A846QV33_9BACT|nr:hypothetical protein [Desulfobaculum xiamenense]NJB68974.1 hypothetical protein [Desulfobaculum xiamenense]